MRVIITKNYDEMSQKAATLVAKHIKDKPNLVLGLATGGTPEKMYELLVSDYKNHKLDFAKVTTFNLDEYVGISQSHPMSYYTYMHHKLFDQVNVPSKNINLPIGTGNIAQNAAAYETKITNAGGIDLQILGIGENAHIAFNEPGSKSTDLTREVHLTDATITANSRYFKSKTDVPKTAISMGIGSILRAKEIILLASGPKKAKAMQATIEGPVTDKVPASFLQKHPNVTIIIDEAAAALLKKK